MTVYILHHYFDTPDVEGNEIIGAFSLHEDAKNEMLLRANAIKAEFPNNFWTEDMTWENEEEIHLGHTPEASYKMATIYCWTITEMEVR